MTMNTDNTNIEKEQFEPLYIPELNIFDAYSQPAPILDFVLKGLLAGTCGGLVSSGGVGKSMLALQLHMLIATGKTIGGLDIFGTGYTGKCTYLGLEDPKEIIQLRIKNMANMLLQEGGGEHDIQQWAENGRVIPAYGQGLKVDDPASEDYLKRICEGQRLVIIDTLRRIHDKEENSNGEMAEVLGYFEKITWQTGSTILFLHHIPKATPSDGKKPPPTARGASALTDNLRYMATLSGPENKELDSFGVAADQRWRHVIFDTSKCNYSAPMPSIWLVKGHGGVFGLNGEKGKVNAAASASKTTTKRKDNGL